MGKLYEFKRTIGCLEICLQSWLHPVLIFLQVLLFPSCLNQRRAAGMYH